MLTSQGQAGGLPSGTSSRDRLPIGIGFLLGRGWSADTLQRAAGLAAAVDQPADETLIKSGLAGEDLFYRALADELGLPFLAKPALGSGARFPYTALAGVAPLAGEPVRFVIAPTGEQLVRVLSRRGLLEHRELAVTTPSALTHAVLRARSVEIAYAAAHGLPDAAGHLSSRDGSTGAQLAILCAFVGALSFGSVVAPPLAVASVTIVSSILFTGMVLLRLATALIDSRAMPDASPSMSDADLPIYSVVVALYREKRVVANLVRALTALDYPSAKLDVKLVIEADDRETAAALARIPLPPFIDVIVAPPGLPRTKPRALNVALPLLRGDLTVIFDAEDVPDPGQLRLAAARFARLPAAVACLQGRLGIYNATENWLTRLFAIEYASLFDVVNPGLAALDAPIPLGGTSNHFRTAVLRTVRGWDAWNVTEDADLGIRLARMGYRVRDLPSWTMEEAPATLNGWMRQRCRWMKGFIQTCTTHSREPLKALVELGPARFCVAVTMTLGAVLSALGYPIFTVLAVLGFRQGSGGEYPLLSSSGLIVFVLGAAAMIVPACVALKRRRLWHLFPWVPLLPLYYGLVSIAAWLALWELLRDPFRWNKTDHGMVRTSRLKAASGGPAQSPPALG